MTMEKIHHFYKDVYVLLENGTCFQCHGYGYVRGLAIPKKTDHRTLWPCGKLLACETLPVFPCGFGFHVVKTWGFPEELRFV